MDPILAIDGLVAFTQAFGIRYHYMTFFRCLAGVSALVSSVSCSSVLLLFQYLVSSPLWIFASIKDVM